MAIYGMKDAANLVIIDKVTGLPVLYIDYANATSSEWSSEAVYATKKGTNAIRWDNARTGTLTLDTELFDFGLLAMVMGSDVKEGKSDIFTRVEAGLDESRTIDLGVDSEIELETISVIKLKQDLVEHDGLPLPNETGENGSLPKQIIQVNVAANDTTAKITFGKSDKADRYIIKRDGEVVGEPTSNSFVDNGLTPEKKVTYTVTPANSFGKAPESPVVEVTTTADGVKEFATFAPTAQAIKNAEKNKGEVTSAGAGSVAWSYADGEIKFNKNALPGEHYAVYFMEATENVRSISIHADKYPGNYEIFANATIREQETGKDELVQIHYKNAKPQSNFSLTQSASEPTNLSVVFDLFPDTKQELAEIKVVQ